MFSVCQGLNNLQCGLWAMITPANQTLQCARATGRYLSVETHTGTVQGDASLGIQYNQRGQQKSTHRFHAGLKECISAALIASKLTISLASQLDLFTSPDQLTHLNLAEVSSSGGVQQLLFFSHPQLTVLWNLVFMAVTAHAHNRNQPRLLLDWNSSEGVVRRSAVAAPSFPASDPSVCAKS